jgi:hypothetical protein
MVCSQRPLRPVRLAAALVAALVVGSASGPALHAARIEIEVAATDQPPLALIEPRDGTELPAGGITGLRWIWRTDGEDVSRYTREHVGPIEEWEVFLSLDGGVTYPIRLTPHLDARHTEVLIEWPRIASDDARLMLRVGIERRELAVAWPQRFRLAFHGGERLIERLSEFVLREGRGEAPLAGAPGVLIWREGPRDASGSAWWCTAREATIQDNDPVFAAPVDSPAVASAAPTIPTPDEAADREPGARSSARPSGNRSASERARSARSITPFALACRRNE